MTFDIVSKFCIKMFSALYYILKEAQAHLSRQKKNNTEYIVVRNYTIQRLAAQKTLLIFLFLRQSYLTHNIGVIQALVKQLIKMESEYEYLWPKNDSHPFILRPQFLQFLEIWFEKSGARNLVREIWFKKSGSANSDFFFLVRDKWLTRKTGGFIL